MNIKEEVENLARIHTEITELSKKHSKKMQSLVERIEQGESSGDRIFDFCVACYHQIGFDEKVRAPYAELDRRLKGKKGQDILSIYSIKTPAPEHGYHQGADVTMHIRLGRLNSDNGLEFDLKDKALVFPAEPHLESGAYFSRH